MITKVENQYLWVESYRPQKVDDCVIPEALKDTFKQFIATGELPHFMFSGTAGVGKTTIAKALCNEIGAEYIIINGSDESGIDTLRTKIRGFASTVSLTDSPKVIIVDEADGLQANSTQPALRSFIEEFSSNCRFIFTCNNKNKILGPIQSRFIKIDFKITKEDKPIILGQFFKRACQILKQENIEFDQKVVAELITKHFPDFRTVLNELQLYSVSGKIDSGILVNMSQESFKDLLKLLKEKDFTNVRKWVGKNSDTDTGTLFRHLYDTSVTYMIADSIPTLVLILADYQYKAAFVADHELNSMGALTEIMANCKFK
jgi:DNA polymerase III delta prime subunit